MQGRLHEFAGILRPAGRGDFEQGRETEKMKKQERRTPEAWKRRRAREDRKMGARWMREDADRRLLPKFRGGAAT